MARNTWRDRRRDVGGQALQVCTAVPASCACLPLNNPPCDIADGFLKRFHWYDGNFVQRYFLRPV